MIKQQPVLMAAGDHVQRKACAPQEILACEQLVALGFGQKAAIPQLAEGLRAELAFGDPGDGMNIAQSAGAFFDVGFKLIAGVVIFAMTGELFCHFRAEKFVDWPNFIRRQLGLERSEQRFIASQRTRLNEVGDDGDVFCRQLRALRHSARAATHFQADIPKEGEQLFQRPLMDVDRGAIMQQQQVDIRVWEQFATAVAANGDQCQTEAAFGDKAQPGFAKDFVDQVRASMDQRIRWGAIVKQTE